MTFLYHRDTQFAGMAIGNWLRANAPTARWVSTVLQGDFYLETYQ